MPVKKKESDIFYTPKGVSAYTPHPIMLGCGDVFIPLVIKGKNIEYTTSCDIEFHVDLNKNTSESNISNVTNKIVSREFTTLDDLINLLPDYVFNFLEVQNLTLKVSFPYYILRETPVSNKQSTYKYDSSVLIIKNRTKTQYFLNINVPYSSLCPISKEISDYGAHSQRGTAVLSVEIHNFDDKNSFWFEDIVSIVDKSCSSPVYNCSNLQDEAYQTEMMYENAFHIEEIGKNIAENLKTQKIKDFNLTLEQKESINTYKSTCFIDSKGYKNDN